MAIDDLLVKLAKLFTKQKLQTVFLINNYDMTIAVLKVHEVLHIQFITYVHMNVIVSNKVLLLTSFRKLVQMGGKFKCTLKSC